MRATYTHLFTPLRKSARGGITLGAEVRHTAPMFEGQVMARDLARDKNCDVEHRVYNDYLRKWDFLETYHPDGTATDSFGRRHRFVENRMRPWAPIDDGYS